VVQKKSAMIFVLDSAWLAQVSSPTIGCVRVSWAPPVPVEVHELAWGPFAFVETIVGMQPLHHACRIERFAPHDLGEE
jgi:hypothetical protein